MEWNGTKEGEFGMLGARVRGADGGGRLGVIAATDLGPHHGSQDDPNMNSLSSRGSRPQSRSRPSSIFRGAFGGMAGTGGTGASTPRSEWEGFEFNPATARKEELRYAEGDVGKSKFARGYFYLLNKSIITRWFLYIFPVLVVSRSRSSAFTVRVDGS